MSTSLNTYQIKSHVMAVDKGWWEPVPDENGHPRVKSLVECIALIMSECGEAIEAYREGGLGNAYVVTDGKPDGWAIELIDVIIRVLDTLGAYDINAAQLMDAKMKYNATRPHRHGGKAV